MHRSAILAAALLLAPAFAHAAAGEAAPPPGRLIEFALEDQFERGYTPQSFAGRHLLILASDRGGSKFNPGWGDALRQALTAAGLRQAVEIVGVSDLRAVPGFLRSFVRGKFPDEPEKWVLMDWTGIFAEAYDLEPKACNILLFDGVGELLYRGHGREVDPATVDAVVEALAATDPG